MKTRPVEVSDSDVLEAVQASWDTSVDSVEYQPMGFGAHHWRACAAGRAVLFVTLDSLGARHSLETLSSAYGAAAALAAEGLEFIHAGIPPFAIPFRDSALSVTPWLAGAPAKEIDLPKTRVILGRLHAASPPPMPAWGPIVSATFAVEVSQLASSNWDGGPLGERARAAISEHLRDIDHWVRRYHLLARSIGEDVWVPTHGEPHAANQVIANGRTLLVDWESLKLAPPERDLRTVGEGRPALLEMFDLEWRLDEISQYARQFAAPHSGTEDDNTAFEDLIHELRRPG